jgi:hypothetical protein
MLLLAQGPKAWPRLSRLKPCFLPKILGAETTGPGQAHPKALD